MSYPILYAPNEQMFENNGIGVLSDAISCKITEERNGAFEVEMEYPISGIHFAEIKDLCILLAKPNPFDQSQPFRIYRITKPLNGICTVYGQHISYDLSGIPVAPFSSTGIIDAFDKLKKNSVVENPFTFETDKSTAANMDIKVPMSARSVLGGSEGTILDAYRGEYKFDRFKVTLYNDRGRDNNVHIRYGRNLTDLKQEENCASVYSAVYPFWSGTIDDVPVMVTLPEKTVACDGTYPLTRVMTLDLSQNFEEQPTVEQLRNAATSYIKSNNVGVPAVSLDVSFVDLSKYDEYKGQKTLENIMLCDTVSVDFQELGVSAKAKVVKTVYDVLLDEYESVAIGEARSNIADTVAGQSGEIKSAFDGTRTFLQKSVDSATNWLSDGNGYMVAVKDEQGNFIEMMSLDDKDIDNAKNVWRWNNSGFGHSNTGINGAYTTAITQDGKIVAEFIAAGRMEGFEFVGSTFTSENTVVFDYDESDAARLQGYFLGTVKLTAIEYIKYDFDENGILSSVDRLRLQHILQDGGERTREVKIRTIIDPSNVSAAIRIEVLNQETGGVGMSLQCGAGGMTASSIDVDEANFTNIVANVLTLGNSIKFNDNYFTPRTVNIAGKDIFVLASDISA